MKVMMSQVNPTVGDVKNNFNIILGCLDRGIQAGVDVVLLPEMVTTGYPPRDLLYNQEIWDQQSIIADRLYKHLRNTVPIGKKITLIYGGIEQQTLSCGNYARYNVAYIIDVHNIRVVRKRLLPCYDVFDETRYFSPCKDPVTPIHIRLSNGQTELCDVLICEDIWNANYRGAPWRTPASYTEDPTSELKGTGPIFVLNASPFWHGKIEATVNLVDSIASRLKRDVFWCNQVGAHDDIVTGGYSFLLTWRQGSGCIDMLKPFAEDEKILPQPLNDTFDHTGLFKPVSNCFIPENFYSPDFDTQCTYQALILHLRDYFRRVGIKTAVIGASGGIDSAVVTALACDALGSENVTTITMPSVFSSEGSISDSEQLAKNLKCRFVKQPIGDIYAAFRKTLLSGGHQKFENPVTDENLQPRIRMALLFAESNNYGQLVLTTGNKSEISMGYFTLGGDGLGGLSVINDLWKTEVYELARFINKQHRGEIIPQSIINKPPSAELKPNQKDTDTLPDYEVLDPILKMLVEENKTVAEVQKLFPKADVFKINRIYQNAEFKRAQMCIGPKISERSYGSGRRMPIARKLTTLS